jgi:hypothetical protein
MTKVARFMLTGTGHELFFFACRTCSALPARGLRSTPDAPPDSGARRAITNGAGKACRAGATPIQSEINTRVAQPRDHFPITVARSLELGGYTVVPAGAPGHGEIVHAQKSGMFGKPAELLLAVRWIEVNGQRIEMRHFRPHTGEDRTTAAGNLTFVPVAGLFSPFVRGGEIVLPVGTTALAQVRVDTRIEGSAASTDVQSDLSRTDETVHP